MVVSNYFLQLTAILQALSIIQTKDKPLTLTLTVQFSEPYVTTQHPYGELIVTNAILVLPALKPKETIA